MDSNYPDDVLEGDNHDETSMYPDIEENVDSPWQNQQSFDVGSMLASVLDPRLFGDQPTQQPQSINQYPAELGTGGNVGPDYPSNEEYEDDEYPSMSYPPVPGEPAQSDEEFVLSSGDESERYVYC